MSRRIGVLARLPSLSLLTGIALTAGGCGSGFSHSIPIPKSAIQQGIDAFMPISSGDYVEEDLPVELVADKATVLLNEGDDRIGVLLNVTVRLPEEMPGPPIQEPSGAPAPPFAPPNAPKIGAPKIIPSSAEDAIGDGPPKTVHGTINAWVGVRYEPSNTSFYCHSPEIAELSFDELPPQFSQPVREVIGKLLTEYLAGNAVYQLEDDSKAEQLATAALKGVAVKDGTLYVTVGR